MKERPILFSGDMVRAIIDGRKTMTRRIITSKAFKQWVEAGFTDEFIKSPENNWHEHCPLGVPGDRLWVKETWTHGQKRHNVAANAYGYDIQYKADGKCVGQYHFKSFQDVPYLGLENPYRGIDRIYKWKPSIHMPRWASRITLEITDVRVERLQEISEKDAKAEGVMPDYPTALYASAFSELWNSINAKRGYGWDANPWVWVISFKVVTK